MVSLERLVPDEDDDVDDPGTNKEHPATASFFSNEDSNVQTGHFPDPGPMVGLLKSAW